MARGINKVILVGNLGDDPETRYMPSGNAVTNISIATSEQWKDKNTGEPVEKTEWHRVIFFNRLAEIAGEYLKKGSKVYVEGSLRTRKWQDNQGIDRFTTEIVAREMQMLDSRQNGDSGQRPQQQAPAPQQQAPAPQQAPQQQRGNPANPPHRYAPGQQQSANYNAPNQPPGGFDDFDDDIPF